MERATFFLMDSNTNRFAATEKELDGILQFVDSLTSAVIVAGHDKDLDGFDSEGETTYSICYDSLVVVYSGGGMPPISEVDKASHRVLIIERPVLTEGVRNDEWKRIVALVSGDKFRETVLWSVPLTILPNLSLLCQGYLAVHSDTNGLAEGVMEYDAADVCRALDIMGWPAAVQSRETEARLHEALRDTSASGPANRQRLREQASSQTYWAPLAVAPDEDKPSLISDSSVLKETEWDPLVRRAGQEQDWIPIQDLLCLLKEQGTPGNKAGIVARAYIELAAKTGGAL